MASVLALVTIRPPEYVDEPPVDVINQRLDTHSTHHLLCGPVVSVKKETDGREGARPTPCELR